MSVAHFFLAVEPICVFARSLHSSRCFQEGAHTQKSCCCWWPNSITNCISKALHFFLLIVIKQVTSLNVYYSDTLRQRRQFPPINHHNYTAVGLLAVVSVSTAFTSPFPLRYRRDDIFWRICRLRRRQRGGGEKRRRQIWVCCLGCDTARKTPMDTAQMERDYKNAQSPFSTAASVRLLKRDEETANGIAQLSPTTK